MKSTSIIILLLFSLSICAQENLFEVLNYDKVVAFEFNGNGNRTIDKVLSESRNRLDQRINLDSTQTQRFEEIISKKDAYGQATAACFDPHFAVIYYSENTIVAQVNVCLSCNYLISSIKIPAVYQKMMDEGTEYERPLKGFSKLTRKNLDEFISSIGFTKYRKPLESIFDE